MTLNTASPRRPLRPPSSRPRTERATRLELMTDRWLAELMRGSILSQRARALRNTGGRPASTGRGRVVEQSSPDAG
jgi:hypothetical protein